MSTSCSSWQISIRRVNGVIRVSMLSLSLNMRRLRRGRNVRYKTSVSGRVGRQRSSAESESEGEKGKISAGLGAAGASLKETHFLRFCKGGLMEAISNPCSAECFLSTEGGEARTASCVICCREGLQVVFVLALVSLIVRSPTFHKTSWFGLSTCL
jgi:hypothetical protein